MEDRTGLDLNKDRLYICRRCDIASVIVDTRNLVPCNVQINDMDFALGILCEEAFG